MSSIELTPELKQQILNLPITAGAPDTCPRLSFVESSQVMDKGIQYRVCNDCPPAHFHPLPSGWARLSWNSFTYYLKRFTLVLT